MRRLTMLALAAAALGLGVASADDTTPPTGQLYPPSNPIVAVPVAEVSSETVFGEVSDASGIASVTIAIRTCSVTSIGGPCAGTFEIEALPLTTCGTGCTFDATLGCTAARTACSFLVPSPTSPGVYEVGGLVRDQAGNSSTLGAVSIIVI